jgi:hypothetical protein
METEVDFRIFYYTRLAEDMRKNDVKQIVYCRKKWCVSANARQFAVSGVLFAKF